MNPDLAPDHNMLLARFIRRAFYWALLILVFVELQTPLGWLIAPHQFLSFNPNYYSPFFAFAVGAVFVNHALLIRQGVVPAMCIGAILFALHIALVPSPASVLAAWLGLGVYYLGLASALILSWLIVRQRKTLHSLPREKPPYALALQAGMLPVLWVMLSWAGLETGARANTQMLDPLLFHFDASLGVQLSALAAQWLSTTSFWTQTVRWVYAALPLFAGLVFALSFCKSTEQENPAPNLIWPAFLIAGLIGSALYLIYPAAGPRYLLGQDFPHTLPPLSQIALAPTHLAPTFLNAMPSLHFAWALLLCLNSRQLVWWQRRLSDAVLVLTLLATLGLGEHYLIDLVVAVPVALLAQTLAEKVWGPLSYEHNHTWRELLTGLVPVLCVVYAGLISAWLIYLRWGAAYFATVGLLNWGLIALTLATCIGLRFKQRLACVG